MTLFEGGYVVTPCHFSFLKSFETQASYGTGPLAEYWLQHQHKHHLGGKGVYVLDTQ